MDVRVMIESIDSQGMMRPDTRPLHLWTRGELAEWCRVLEARLVMIDTAMARMPEHEQHA